MALLKFKRSATPSKVPTTSDLALGELALNTYDGKVYMKKDDGTQAIVEVGGTSGGGTVTSVDVSGGTTGLTFSGGPVTSSGTITQGGTLNVANGGTGATSLTSGYVLKGNGTSPLSASVIYDNGTNVGIGTSSPSRTLDVDGAARFDTVYVDGSSNRYIFLTSSDGAGECELRLGDAADTDAGAIAYDNATDSLQFRANGNERLRITSAGSVGIGTTNPSFYSGKLTVAGGNIAIEGGNRALFWNTGGTGVASIQGVGTNELSFSTSNSYTERLRITSAGNVGIGTSSPISRLDVVGPTNTYVRINDGTVNLAVQAYGTGSSAIVGTTTNHPLALWANSAERLRITSAGNVGIGTSSPSSYNAGGNRLVVGGGSFEGMTIASATEGNIYFADGTTGTQTYSGVIGYNHTSDYMTFYANANERMRIDSSGSVIASVDMRAPIFYDSDNTGFYLDLTSSTSLNAAGSLIASGNITLNNGANRRVRLGSATNYYYDIQSTGNDFQIIEAGTTPRLTIKYPSGSVGIGTTAPTGLLSVASTSSAGTTIGSWTSAHSVFGPNVGSTTGAALGLGYNTTTDTAEIVSIAPSVAWKNMRLIAATMDFETISGRVQTNQSFRAPIFYDSNNTGYYFDGSSTSVLNALTVNGGAVYRSDWTTRFQSPSDFVNGTLVSTDIPATASSGDSFVIEITGKSYSASNPPFKAVAQGYLYNNTIINFSGINYGGEFSSYIRVFEDGGVLKFWWPRISYWNSFNVNVMSMDSATNGTITRNRVTSITNSTEPTGSKKQTINLAGFMRSDISATNSVDLRAPIFYDSGNTGYYVDPASTSVVNQINYAAGLYFSGNTNYGINGTSAYFDTVNSGAVGDALELCYARGNEVRIGPSGGNLPIKAATYYDYADTSYYVDPNGTSNVNAMSSYSYQGNGNVGGTGNASWHPSGIYSAGYNWLYGGISAGGGDISSVNSVYANIYYDSGNTAYYADPASRSQLSNITVTAGGTEVGIRFRGNTADFVGRYSNYVSLYNQLGGELKIFDSGYLNSSVYGQFAGSVRAPIFYDSDNTGFNLNANGSAWQLQTPSGYLRAGPMNTSYCHFNTDRSRYYFDKEVQFDGGISDYSGNWRFNDSLGQHDASLRAPHFYDSNNTAYYVNPASESVLSTVTFFGELNLSAAGQTYVDHTGTIIFRNQSGYATSATLTTSGNFTATGNVTAYSDIRVKDNVKQIEGALDKVQAIRGVTYNRTDLEDTERRYGGVIAQEIEKVLPEAIFESDDRKAVDYNATIGLLIEAIKELKAEVETLKKG